MLCLKINYVDMKKFRVYMVICTLLLQSNYLISQNQTNTNSSDFEKRLSNLENYKENINTVSKIEVQAAKEELKKEFDSDYKNVRNLLALILGLGLPTTLYAVYMMYWGFSKKMKNIINEKIETIVEHKREEIIKLINNQEFEKNLKNNKKLLVISENEDAQDEIKRMMSNFKFKNLTFRINKSFQNMPEHDLIIFNNCDDSLTQQDINEFMDSIDDEDTYFVAYTSKQLERNPRLNFANSKFTLYHNILTTLSFVETLKQDE